jgi:branched-chain amino acid transport system substrate-binding protein
MRVGTRLDVRRVVACTALAICIALVASACGNSKSDAGSTTSTAPGSTQPGDTGTDKKVAVTAPGVSDNEIRVGGVASVTNPLGGKYGDAFIGAQAAIDKVNADGGLYGRKLVLAAKRDDKVANNKAEVEGLLTSDNVFAVLPIATLLFTGADTLVSQNVPTFGWTINPEWEGSAEVPKKNMFGQSGSFLCFDCPSPTLPGLAKSINAKKIAVLAYSVPQSAGCADGVKNSFEKFGATAGAEVAFMDKALAYGTTDLSVQVSKMKDAGVDLVTTCMDTNGVVTLAKELKKQQLNAKQYLPNGYDHEFVKEFGDLFEGSIVRTDFVQWELPEKEHPQGLKDYLAAMKTAGAEPSENSLSAWLNVDLFVEGMKKAGPEFDRQKLIDGINSLTNYNGGGLLHNVNWTKAHTERDDPDRPCQFLSVIKSSEFSPDYSKPGKPFICVDATTPGKLTMTNDS